MKKSVIAAIAALACTATPALAADWVMFSDGSNVDFYADKDSVEKYDDNTINIWIKSVRTRPDSDGAVRTLTLDTIDCNDMTYFTHELVGYRYNGTVVSSNYYDERNSGWERLVPGSVYGEFGRELCSAAFGEFR